MTREHAPPNSDEGLILMIEPGAVGPDPSSTNAQHRSPGTAGDRERLGNPTRLVPRRPSPPEAALEIVDAAPVAAGLDHEPYEPPSAERPTNAMFAPRSFANGRVRVWGFAPGCLVASLIASVVLTILLNMIF